MNHDEWWMITSIVMKQTMKHTIIRWKRKHHPTPDDDETKLVVMKHLDDYTWWEQLWWWKYSHEINHETYHHWSNLGRNSAGPSPERNAESTILGHPLDKAKRGVGMDQRAGQLMESSFISFWGVLMRSSKNVEYGESFCILAQSI